MSLDVYLEKMQLSEVYNGNITHNLTKMAEAAGIYKCLWRPEENGIEEAGQLIPLLKEGLEKLKANPEYFKTFDSPNRWGVYEDFVEFVADYLKACIEHPDATIRVWK